MGIQRLKVKSQGRDRQRARQQLLRSDKQTERQRTDRQRIGKNRQNMPHCRIRLTWAMAALSIAFDLENVHISPQNSSYPIVIL